MEALTFGVPVVSTPEAGPSFLLNDSLYGKCEPLSLDKWSNAIDYYVNNPISQSEKEKFIPVAKELTKLGLPLVGLDVIDEKIIEINVTSPCYFIKEVNGHFNCNLEKKITGFIIARVENFLCSKV